MLLIELSAAGVDILEAYDFFIPQLTLVEAQFLYRVVETGSAGVSNLKSAPV